MRCVVLQGLEIFLMQDLKDFKIKVYSISIKEKHFTFQYLSIYFVKRKMRPMYTFLKKLITYSLVHVS